MCVAMEIAGFFHGCKNINLMYLISAAVTYKDYHSQSDKLNSELILGEKQTLFWEKEAAVNEVFYFEDLNLNVHSYLYLFRHWRSSSFEKHR